MGFGFCAVEGLVTVKTDAFDSMFKGRRVLVTGHTGFKGGWLTLWLESLGAKVTGIALPPTTSPNLFEATGMRRWVDDHTADIRDLASLRAVFARTKPEFVFHLAAQPIVGLSYEDPVGTVATNVLGTVHVLECLRALADRCAAVIVTSDKCYENAGHGQAYRESDPMGGSDPYSASKGCAELMVAAYQRSYFQKAAQLRVASGRAGNVIGGGDWSMYRIVPDCARALVAGQPLVLRRPQAVRSWLHVLDAVYGYLLLAARLWADPTRQVCTGWNFGPEAEGVCSVEKLATLFAAAWGGGSVVHHEGAELFHEAPLLVLDSQKARQELGWCPAWSFGESVRRTAAWYRNWHQGSDVRRLCQEEIAAYRGAIHQPGGEGL